VIGGIILAAGAATRMGRQKLLLPFGGSPVLHRVIQELSQGGVTDILVVTGADSDEVGRVADAAGVVAVPNPDYTHGMLSSVRAGLAAAPGSWDAAMLALGDQPLVTRATVRELVRVAETRPRRIVVPAYKGRRGHPLILPREFWNEALTDHDDIGLRGVLRAHPSAVSEVTFDSEDVLSDMDTPEDYQNALARLSDRDEPSTS